MEDVHASWGDNLNHHKHDNHHNCHNHHNYQYNYDDHYH
jgi:hypothetical protein